jgi:hypothetical protein
MLVAAIQGLVGAFHEDLTPFNDTCGSETRDRTNDYFLDKGRLHPLFKSTRSAMVKSGLGQCRRPIRLGRWLLTSTGPARRGVLVRVRKVELGMTKNEGVAVRSG